MIKKGDSIKLVKPMGEFRNVGEICEVLDVVDGGIDFRFGGYHKGHMSMDELARYFEVVLKENETEFVVGQLITLKTEYEGLKPMKQWDFFEIEEISSTGVARLFCHADGATCFVPVNMLNSHFASGNESPYIKYEDNEDCSCEDYPCAEYLCKCENGELKPLGVYENGIDRLLDGAEIKTFSVFGKCTIVACKLPNGFVITESSACVSPENYNEEVGIEICMRKIKDKLWELEGYFLQKTIQDEEFCCDIEGDCIKDDCLDESGAFTEKCACCEESECSCGA